MGKGRGISEREAVHRKKRGNPRCRQLSKDSCLFCEKVMKDPRKSAADCEKNYKHKGVLALKIGTDIDINIYKS